MTTSTRKPRTEADRKEQILAAALPVFDEKGYETATISDVGRPAGVAPGPSAPHFPSHPSP